MKLALFVLASGCVFAQQPCAPGMTLLSGTYPDSLISPIPSSGLLSDFACKIGDAVLEGFQIQVLNNPSGPLTNWTLTLGPHTNAATHTIEFVWSFPPFVVGEGPNGFLLQYTVGDPQGPQWVGVQSECPTTVYPCGADAPFVTMEVCGWQLSTSACLGGSTWPEVITGSGAGGAVSTLNSSSVTVLDYCWWNGSFFNEVGYTPLLSFASHK